MGLELGSGTLYIGGEPLGDVSDIHYLSLDLEESEGYIRKLDSREASFEVNVESATIQPLRNCVIHDLY